MDKYSPFYDLWNIIIKKGEFFEKKKQFLSVIVLAIKRPTLFLILNLFFSNTTSFFPLLDKFFCLNFIWIKSWLFAIYSLYAINFWYFLWITFFSIFIATLIFFFSFFLQPSPQFSQFIEDIEDLKVYSIDLSFELDFNYIDLIDFFHQNFSLHLIFPFHPFKPLTNMFWIQKRGEKKIQYNDFGKYSKTTTTTTRE